MAKLIWTDESLDSLRRIGDYVSDRSPEAAASVTEGVWRKAQLLIEFPEIGWRHDDIVGRDVRSLLYGHYRIVYEVHECATVRVLSVVHASMDIDQLRF